ncbi:hypothetical protein [Mesorhizobium sp.]|uniref:hypothetical protein n=1 Tax=Mesorhizobium sp. TaxID=1871066 RepID=UPI000FE9F167|nr:hypothetical protein [Mesorhizobium sp.]RWC58932.1 MAG: hypothetical protein EOS56_18660 [Mesorhizobium sp.]RWC66544.1 MAG: hypothetical protein EOS29_04015 [Mesorhizobium sp.]
MIIVHDKDGRIQETLSMYQKGHGKHLTDMGKSFIIVLDIPLDAWTAWSVVAGKLEPRPSCQALVTVAGRAIFLSNVPPGSTVTAWIDGIAVPVEAASIELDEPGPVTIRISPPWPIMEAVHDVEIE